MTPSARIAAAIEVLDAVIHAALTQGPPADRLLAEWFRAHRFAGSTDKRVIREHVYAAIRACGPVPHSGRAAILRALADEPEETIAALFDGSAYGPACRVPGEPVAEGGPAPDWLVDRLARSGIAGGGVQALLGRAPLDLRINRLKVPEGLPDLPIPFATLPHLPDAIRLPAGTPVEQWAAYEAGLVEVQDAGSQLACALSGAAPGEVVIDLCAGAGGKTLALAAMMANQGTLLAADTDRARLARLAPRAARAGARIAGEVLLDPGREIDALGTWQGKADLVLVDAPCSGTGTWRRNPEARWRLAPSLLGRLAGLQARLLDLAAELLRPGGRLVYVTCSLLDEEGAGQAAGFLARHPGWQAREWQGPPGTARPPGLRLDPLADGSDGFFIACLVKP